MLEKAPNIDLREYAKEAESKRKTPSYEELCRDVFPQFQEFVEKLRNTPRNPEKEGVHKIIVLGTGGTFQSAETEEGIAPSGSLQESFDALRFPEKDKHSYNSL